MSLIFSKYGLVQRKTDSGAYIHICLQAENSHLILSYTCATKYESLGASWLENKYSGLYYDWSTPYSPCESGKGAEVILFGVVGLTGEFLISFCDRMKC